MSTAVAYETVGADRLLRVGFGDYALWTAAFAVVLVAQAAAFYAISNWRDTPPEPPGDQPPAIMVELSEIAVAPQVEDIAADAGELAMAQLPAEATEAEPIEEIDEVEPEPVEETPEPVTEEQVEPEPIEPMVEEVAEPVTPEPVVEPPTQTIEPVPESEVLDTAEPAEPEQEVVPEQLEQPLEAKPLEEIIPDVTESELAEVVVPMPMMAPAAVSEKRREYAEVQREAAERREEERKEAHREKAAEQKKAEQKKAAEKKQKEAASSAQTAPKSVDAKADTRMAAPKETVSQKRTANITPAKWQQRVQAHIERHKRFPASSRRNGESGRPQVKISIDANGNVLSVSLVRSTGFPDLDQATLDMVRRSSPVPAPPPDAKRSLIIPFNFNLRN